MRITVQSVPSLSASEAGLVAVAVTAPFDRAVEDLGIPADAGAALVAEASRTGFEAELSTCTAIISGGTWYALIGAGPSPATTDFRRVGSAAVALGKQLKVADAVLLGVRSADRARFTAEGAYLKGYKFDAYKAPYDGKAAQFTRMDIVGDDTIGTAIKDGVDLAESVSLARDVANEHPGKCTPLFLAATASEIAERYGFECKIRGEDELQAGGFNLLLAVGRGSTEPSQLIHLIYRPEGTVNKRVCVVGKGVTYDSGGYSMKPPAGQINMHLDMGGAAAVLGAAEAIGRTKPPGVEVHFIVPTVENLVSGNAFKLNEIVTGYAGISVEVLNTDAEGRLILADALAYAVEQDPDEIIDLATLTGACVVALGNETAGVFSNDDGLAGRFISAADSVDESVWRMPLTARIEPQLKSEFADVKNIGSRWGGAISAGLFLKKFVGDCAWAHIDIAGPGMMDAEWEYICKGGTGFGVLAVHEYLTRAGA